MKLKKMIAGPGRRLARMVEHLKLTPKPCASDLEEQEQLQLQTHTDTSENLVEATGYLLDRTRELDIERLGRVPHVDATGFLPGGSPEDLDVEDPRTTMPLVTVKLGAWQDIPDRDHEGAVEATGYMLDRTREQDMEKMMVRTQHVDATGFLLDDQGGLKMPTVEIGAWEEIQIPTPRELPRRQLPMIMGFMDSSGVVDQDFLVRQVLEWKNIYDSYSEVEAVLGKDEAGKKRDFLMRQVLEWKKAEPGEEVRVEEAAAPQSQVEEKENKVWRLRFPSGATQLITDQDLKHDPVWTQAMLEHGTLLDPQTFGALEEDAIRETGRSSAAQVDGPRQMVRTPGGGLSEIGQLILHGLRVAVDAPKLLGMQKQRGVSATGGLHLAAALPGTNTPVYAVAVTAETEDPAEMDRSFAEFKDQMRVEELSLFEFPTGDRQLFATRELVSDSSFGLGMMTHCRRSQGEELRQFVADQANQPGLVTLSVHLLGNGDVVVSPATVDQADPLKNGDPSWKILQVQPGGGDPGWSLGGHFLVSGTFQARAKTKEALKALLPNRPGPNRKTSRAGPGPKGGIAIGKSTWNPNQFPGTVSTPGATATGASPEKKNPGMNKGGMMGSYVSMWARLASVHEAVSDRARF